MAVATIWLLAVGVGCAQQSPAGQTDTTAADEDVGVVNDGTNSADAEANDVARDIDALEQSDADADTDASMQPLPVSCAVTATALFAGRKLPFAWNRTDGAMVRGPGTSVYIASSFGGYCSSSCSLEQYDWLTDQVTWSRHLGNVPHSSRPWLLPAPAGARVVLYGLSSIFVVFGPNRGDYKWTGMKYDIRHGKATAKGSRIAAWTGGDSIEILDWGVLDWTDKSEMHITSSKLISQQAIQKLVPGAVVEGGPAFADNGDIWFPIKRFAHKPTGQVGDLSMCRVSNDQLECPHVGVLPDGVYPAGLVAAGAAGIMIASRWDQSAGGFIGGDAATVSLSTGKVLWWGPLLGGKPNYFPSGAGLLVNPWRPVAAAFVRATFYGPDAKTSVFVTTDGSVRGGIDACEIHGIVASGDAWLTLYRQCTHNGHDYDWSNLLLQISDDWGHTSCASAPKCMGEALASCPNVGICQRQACSEKTGCIAESMADGTPCGATGKCKKGVCVVP